MNLGQNFPERLKWAKMGRNLIRGGMEGVTIPFYTPVQDIPAIPAGTERNP